MQAAQGSLIVQPPPPPASLQPQLQSIPAPPLLTAAAAASGGNPAGLPASPNFSSDVPLLGPDLIPLTNQPAQSGQDPPAAVAVPDPITPSPPHPLQLQPPPLAPPTPIGGTGTTAAIVIPAAGAVGSVQQGPQNGGPGNGAIGNGFTGVPLIPAGKAVGPGLDSDNIDPRSHEAAAPARLPAMAPEPLWGLQAPSAQLPNPAPGNQQQMHFPCGYLHSLQFLLVSSQLQRRLQPMRTTAGTCISHL